MLPLHQAVLVDPGPDRYRENPVLHCHNVVFYLLNQDQHKHPAASRGCVFSFSATNQLSQPYGSRIIDLWCNRIRCSVRRFFAAGNFFYNKYQQDNDKNDVHVIPPLRIKKPGLSGTGFVASSCCFTHDAGIRTPVFGLLIYAGA